MWSFFFSFYVWDGLRTTGVSFPLWSGRSLSFPLQETITASLSLPIVCPFKLGMSSFLIFIDSKSLEMFSFLVHDPVHWNIDLQIMLQRSSAFHSWLLSLFISNFNPLGYPLWLACLKSHHPCSSWFTDFVCSLNLISIVSSFLPSSFCSICWFWVWNVLVFHRCALKTEEYLK